MTSSDAAQNAPAQVELADRPSVEGVARPKEVHSAQPRPHQAMDIQRPHDDTQVNLRGGDGGGCCPGRFCFCVPCPLPCNCCIIPL